MLVTVRLYSDVIVLTGLMNHCLFFLSLKFDTPYLIHINDTGKDSSIIENFLLAHR